MNTDILNELTSEMASNVFQNLTDQQILFLKFCNGYNLNPGLLRTNVTDKKGKIFRVQGLIWKYSYISFKNNGNFLDNQLLIHLKQCLQIKIKIKQNEAKSSVSLPSSSSITGYIVGHPQLSSNIGSLVYSTYTTTSSSSFDINRQQILKKEDLDHMQNSKLNDKSSDDLYISLTNFCKNFKSQKFQINEIIQDKKLKIIVV